MHVDMLTLLYQFLTTNGGACTLADLHALQRQTAITYPQTRCPACHRRLFDGWIFGEIKCPNRECGKIFIGRLDKFVEALQNSMLEISPR
jgi:NAD-dependent DNA ligase